LGLIEVFNISIELYSLEKIVINSVLIDLGMCQSAFDILTDELTDLLRQKNDGKIVDSEQGYSFSYLNISVGVYREMRPFDVMEMIKVMKADVIPIVNNKDIALEMRKTNHWATIGVGVAGYYQQ